MKLFGGGKKKQNAVRAYGEDYGYIPEVFKADRMETVVIHPESSRKRKPLRRVLTFFVLIAVLAAAAVIGYGIWEKSPEINLDGPISLGKPKDEAQEEGSDKSVLVLPLPAGEAPLLETEESVTDQAYMEMPGNIRKKDCYTFVIAAYDQIGASTDTILVGRMDVGEGSLDFVSIPRDTLVNVDWGVKKINTVMVYEDKDPERFINELNSILGFTVDCYAFVDIRAVEKLVDAIGGVYYTVPRNMDYDDPTQDLHIHISSGYQWLSGKQAVQVLRYRVGNNNTGYPTGDLGRINTQHDFLLSIASQMLSIGNIPNIDKAIEIFEEYVVTNLETNNLAFFLREFLKMEIDNISFSMIPGKAIGIRGGSYYEIDLVPWVEIINEYLNPFTVEIGAHNLDVLSWDENDGSVMSTTGEIIPRDSFYDFANYKG